MAFRNRPQRPALPSAGALRRERRALLEERATRLEDLGGLIYEMFRADRFNDALVRERCDALLELDRRLDALDDVYRAATSRAPVRRCACGAELAPFAQFCSTCGAPVPPPSP